MAVTKALGSPTPTFYTVEYRRKGSRRFYRCGYRSESIADLVDMAHNEVDAGTYAAAKVVDAYTGKVITSF